MKKKKELRFIEERLRRNDWVYFAGRSEYEGLKQYRKTIDDIGNAIAVFVAMTPESLCVSGEYGVFSVEIAKYYRCPYNRDDLIAMQDLISKSEWELLKIGIPFRANYAFNGREGCIRKNLELREQLKLKELEEGDA